MHGEGGVSAGEHLGRRRDPDFLHPDVGAVLRHRNGDDRGVARAHARAGKAGRPARGHRQPAAGRARPADRRDAARQYARSISRASALLTTVLVAMVGDERRALRHRRHDRAAADLRRSAAETVAINYPGPHLAGGGAGRAPSSSTLFGPVLLRRRKDRARRALSVRPAARREAPAAVAAGRAEKRRRPDAQGGRRRPRRPRHVRRPARSQGAGGLRRHGPSHQDGRARRRPAASPKSCAKSWPRPIPACRCGAARPTTSSACCTPRTCCGR